MTVFDGNEDPSQQSGGELKLASRAVSRGVAIGRIVCLHGRTRQFYRIDLKRSEVEQEVRRFSAAVRLTRKQLKSIISHTNELPGEKKAGIFETHLLILEDRTLISKIEGQIRTRLVNAEWAAETVLDGYIADYRKVSDEHLRERYIDLEDISDRLLIALGGEQPTVLKLEKDSIIAAREVRPSTLVELAASRPQAIITENGGWTSHTFILARELSIPSVTGVRGVMRRVKTGDEVIVDGYNGNVILNPAKETVREYEIAAEHFHRVSSETSKAGRGAVKTLDGRQIIIRANLDLDKGYSMARRLGAEGIGLYRSEFLFNQFKGFPTEAEQFEAYSKIGKLVGAKGVRIRTFDLGADQLTDEKSVQERNPALGLRGIRLSLSHPGEFRIQLRALLRASAGHKIDIILPMIGGVAELVRSKEILQRQKEYLKKRKIGFGDPRIGAMIEVPSAVLTIADIAKEVDFFSLGTNDLVQYMLAVDRDNESIADWFKTLHPAVIKSIGAVLGEAEKNDIPTIVCGEMAGSPFYVPLLIGLGARELSMNVNSISQITRTVEGIALEEARDLADCVSECRSAAEIESLVRGSFEKKWSHLFSPDILPIK